MPVSDYDSVIDPGCGRPRRFYAGANLVAADLVGASGATITVGGVTVPLCSESNTSGQYKLVQRDGTLLYPIIVTPPPTDPPPGGGNANLPWSASSFWNTPINQATAVYSAPYHGGALPALSGFGNGWVGLEADSYQIWYSTNADPTWTITTTATKWRPSPASFSFHVPAGWTPNSGGSDNASTIANTDTGEMIECYQATRGSGNTVLCNGYGRMFFTTGDGFCNGQVTFVQGNNTNSGCRAPGWSGWGGLIMKADLGGGPILHALACSAPGSLLAAGANASDTAGFTFPAIQMDTGGSGNGGSIKEGGRLAIPPATANPGGVLASGLGLIMFNNAKTYGWFMADRTSQTVGLVADRNSCTSADIAPIREYWQTGGSILGAIWPLLKICTNY